MLPGTMITDMGTEYTSGNFEQITELGVTVQNLPAYRPELKGPVEKFFDLIQTEFKKYLKGKGVIEPDYRERGAHDYRKDACLTIQDFEMVILRCILYYNSQRVLGNFPYTEDMIQEGIHLCMGQKAAGSEPDSGFQRRTGIDTSSKDNRTFYTFRLESAGVEISGTRIYRAIFDGWGSCNCI